MSYFARKIEYCANECSFVALLEISRAKGKKPFKFILYRYDNGYYVKGDERHEMIEFNNNKKALKTFPYGPVVFTEWNELSECEKFLYERRDPFLWKRRKNLWIKTTGWLYGAAVGGGYQIHEEGEWVKVGKPNPWKNRRKKKKPLKFGELGHLLIVEKKRLTLLKEALNSLPCEGEFEYDSDGFVAKEAEDEMGIINEEIGTTEDRINCLMVEMKFYKGKSLRR